MFQTLSPQIIHNPTRLRTPSASITVPGPTTNRNHAIQSLCKKGKLKQAIQLLSHEQSPSQRTYELLIQTCAHKKSLPDAVTVHRNLIDNGFHQDPFLATKLIGMYSDLDSLEESRKVFDETTDRTIFVWNALFRALSLAGYGEEVLSLYRRMNSIGPPSDRFTYTYALKACAVSELNYPLLWHVKEIHAHVLRHGYEGNVHVMTTLIDMYSRFHLVNYAITVFSSMPTKNLVSWSALIACLSRNGRAFESLEVFHEMIAESSYLCPNSVTMVSVLQACSSLSALEKGKSIHGYILRKGLDSILPVMNGLVTMYGRCGDLKRAKHVFDQMKKRDIVSWNSLISSYSIHGLGEKALELFEEMVGLGISPSPITFVSLLGACSHSGLVERGKILFDSMVKEYKIHPTKEHYACMIDLLGRANRLEEAAKIVLDMREEPAPETWGSLLGSCRIHCNVKLAEIASKSLFELEPRNAGNYVLLADIYSEAEMWEDVKRVKKLLEDRGLRKVPGVCWIEIRRKLYCLKSVDELNPQIEQVHALLLNISREMRDRGFVPETKHVLYDVEAEEKGKILLGHSEKLAVGFGLINSGKGEIIRVSKNLRLCEDCHTFTKFVSGFAGREILVRDINRFHRFRDGECSCGDYW